MARSLGKLKVILPAVVDRLIDQIEGVTKANCYVALNPDSLPNGGVGGILYVVSPTSGRFDDAYFEGGGVEQLFANAGLVVKIHSPLQLDQAGRDIEFLTDEAHGILDRATDVLAALSNWSPEDVSGNPQTRDPLYPMGYTLTRAGRSIGAIELEFACNFDWNVTS